MMGFFNAEYVIYDERRLNRWDSRGCASSLGSLCVLGILFEEVDLGFGCRTVG